MTTRRTIERAKRYADGGVTDPLAGMSPADLARLRVELAAKQRPAAPTSRKAPAGDAGLLGAAEGMLTAMPIIPGMDLHRRLRATPEENAEHLSQAGHDMLGMVPVLGNVLSARDAITSAGDAASAAGEGRWGAAAGNSVLSALGGLGAVTGLPWSRAARRAAAEGSRTAGIFAGIGAKTADRKALARAEKMREAGSTRDEIWKKTGWGWRPDGSPYFEIDDSKAALDLDNLIDENRRLDDVLQHDELYKAYPETRETLIVSPEMSDLGLFVSGDGDWLNPQIRLKAGQSVTDMVSTGLHEVQHNIQEIDNIPRGGPGHDPDYHRLAGEVEARNVETRRNWDAKRRREMGPWRTQDVPDERQIARYGGGRQSKLVNADTDQPETGFRDFYLQHDDGSDAALINGIYRADEAPNEFRIEWMKAAEKNQLGKAEMREIIKGIKERYPQVTKITGNRITGARDATGAKGPASLDVTKYARGGLIDRARRYAAGGRVTVGPVEGTTGGREDALEVRVPEGAYVIPADVVAALGEGNTGAGMQRLRQQFGRSTRTTGALVPILISDGEFVVTPDQVELVGGPDTLDQFVLQVRRQYAEHLNQLPGPNGAS